MPTEYSLIHMAGASGFTVVAGLVIHFMKKGISVSRNGKKPSTTLTIEVGKMKGQVVELKENCKTKHVADEKRFEDFKTDIKDDIGRVEQAVKDQATSSSNNIKGVHSRLDTMILAIKNGHGKTD